MILRFALSGSVVFETRADAVPPVGAKVIFRMRQAKKGFEQNTLVSAIVQGDPCPPVYDYSEGEESVVSIDLDEFEELPGYERPLAPSAATGRNHKPLLEANSQRPQVS